MQKERLVGNITKWYFFSFFSHTLIVMPIIVPFFTAHGLMMRDIFLLQGIFSVAVLILELPTGYISDILGRRKTVIAASIIWTLGWIVYSLSFTFWEFVLAELMLSVGSSLLSGTDTAFLYDSLVALKRTDEYKKIEGRAQLITRLSEGLGAILGGFLAVYSLRFPFYAMAIASMSSIFFALSLVEPPREILQPHRGHIHSIRKIVLFSLHQNKKLKWLIFYTSIVFAGTLTGVWFFQPYFAFVSIPIAYFGLLWALSNFAVGLFSATAHKFEYLVGRKAAFILPSIAVVFGFLFMGLVSVPAGAAVIFLINFARGGFLPISNHYINELAPSSIRATVLSIKNIPQRLLFAIVSPFFGWVADIYTLQVALLFSAGFFSVFFVIALCGLRRTKVV